jgi:hypothetical protein
VSYALTPYLVARLSLQVFEGNVAAGWWSDLATGESLVGKRNVGELLMLITTEIAEAAEGFDRGLLDDKLHHRSMFEVELADTAIRVFDLGGGYALDLGRHLGALQEAGVRGTVAGAGTAFNLLMLVRHVAAAMEAHRKGNAEGLGRSLALLLLGLDEMAFEARLDLLGAISEKRSYNATRADHSLAARRAAGGKAC